MSGSWVDDPRLWIPLGGLVAQAAITWFMVRNHEVRIVKIEDNIDSLREWRAEEKALRHRDDQE